MTHAPLPGLELPLTAAQLGVVSAQLVRPTTTDFAVGEVVELVGGPLDVGALVAAVALVLDETEALRTRFVVDDGVRQVVEPRRGPGAPGHVEVRRTDLTALSADDARARARELVQQDLTTPFDLARAGLARTRVLVLDARTVHWSLVVHHAVLDAYGLTLVVRRTAEVYARLVVGEPAGPSPFGAFADVVGADRAYAASPTADSDREHWLGRLAGAGSDADEALRCGFSERPASAGGAVRRAVGRDVALDPVQAAAATVRGSWPDVVLAAFAVHLALVSGRRHVTVGVPAMNRMGSVAATVPTLTVNVLPVVIEVDPFARVLDLVALVKDRVAEVRRHGRYPAERIVRDAGGPAAGARLAELNVKLFDQRPQFGDIVAAVRNLSEGPVDDLSVSVAPAPVGPDAPAALRFAASAPADRFTGDETDARLDELAHVVEQVAAADPDARVGEVRLRGADGAAEAELVARAQGPGLVEAPTDVATLFDRAVATTPHATALVADVTLTFSELDARVAHLAGRLVAAGVGAETRVALDLPRSTDHVVALLALHRCGGVALLLDDRTPPARRTALAARHAAPVVVTDDAATWAGTPSRVLAPRGAATAPVRSALPVHPDALAYVLHTSGSTGEPKAVGISRTALAHLVDHHAREVVPPVRVAGQGVGQQRVAQQRVAQTMPLVFDGSWDTLLTLLLGHELHLLPVETYRDPALLVDALVERRIQRIDLTPTVMDAVVAAGLFERAYSLETVSVGGEACPPALWRTLRAQPVRVLNLYGPTEYTVDAVGAEGDEADEPVIGRPLTATTAVVLDQHLAPVPTGVVGELYLAGPQLARGYLGRPDLTAERFVAAPWGPPGARMYRTGDLASRDADGLLHYAGRRDQQVKIRGFRVEPAETEAALLALPGVAQATVQARRSPLGTRLVGYVVLDAAGQATGAVLRGALADVLPDHLVPAVVVVLDALPLSGNGKLDAAALPEPEATTGRGRAPGTPAEDAVVHAVASALGIDAAALSADDDFFGVGGDSIRAIHCVARLRERGWRGTVQDVFEGGTVAGIAARLTALPPAPAAPAAVSAPLVDLSTGDLDRLGALLVDRRRTRKAR